MNRRKFLLNSSISLGTLPLFANTPVNKIENAKFPLFDLHEWTISRMQKELDGGGLTSADIVEKYIRRIEEFDVNGPAVNSVLALNPKAVEQAAMLDDERKKGVKRGDLHGIPVLVKDNINTRDIPTTAGSMALKNSYPKNDAFIIQKLKEAGAIILGKSNLSEWANFRSTRSSSGWSGIGGQTKNPYALNRNPCGSSSGSGAAVSANLCAAAIGTETDGSIVCPSNANGIVGIKPTVGLISRSGIIPISKTQDTAGPMCRTLTDAAIVLKAMAGVDANDPGTHGYRGKMVDDITIYLNKNGLQNKRIGVAREMMGFHENVDYLMEEAIRVMREKGAEVIDIEPIFQTEGIHEAEYTVLLYEFKDGINKYLGALSNSNVKTLDDLIVFNKEHENVEMPYFKQEIFEKSNKKGDLNSKEYKEALIKCMESSRDNGIDRIMKTFNLHAIIAPTGGPAWVTDLVNGDHFLGGSSSAAAISGYPNITVPAGFVHGLPVGISFFGRAFSEPELLQIAYAYEQSTNHREPPQFREHLP